MCTQSLLFAFPPFFVFDSEYFSKPHFTVGINNILFLGNHFLGFFWYTRSSSLHNAFSIIKSLQQM